MGNELLKVRLMESRFSAIGKDKNLDKSVIALILVRNRVDDCDNGVGDFELNFERYVNQPF